MQIYIFQVVNGSTVDNSETLEATKHSPVGAGLEKRRCAQLRENVATPKINEVSSSSELMWKDFQNVLLIEKIEIQGNMNSLILPGQIKGYFSDTHRDIHLCIYILVRVYSTGIKHLYFSQRKFNTAIC